MLGSQQLKKLCIFLVYQNLYTNSHINQSVSNLPVMYVFQHPYDLSISSPCPINDVTNNTYARTQIRVIGNLIRPLATYSHARETSTLRTLGMSFFVTAR